MTYYMRQEDILKVMREHPYDITCREIVDIFYGPDNHISAGYISDKLNSMKKYHIVKKVGVRKNHGKGCDSNVWRLCD